MLFCVISSSKNFLFIMWPQGRDGRYNAALQWFEFGQPWFKLGNKNSSFKGVWKYNYRSVSIILSLKRVSLGTDVVLLYISCIRTCSSAFVLSGKDMGLAIDWSPSNESFHVSKSHYLRINSESIQRRGPNNSVPFSLFGSQTGELYSSL